MISKNLYLFALLFPFFPINCFIHLGQWTHLKIYIAIKLLTPLNFYIKKVSPSF